MATGLGNLCVCARYKTKGLSCVGKLQLIKWGVHGKKMVWTLNTILQALIDGIIYRHLWVRLNFKAST